ncbi:MAG: phosphatidate cytidylyltransferase [Rhodospirillales bacterium]|jgi:phosphatidate cytidylyltransferase|nr:phosphatidate cytidylyltransferase [Rhodospirillales bacterium]
MRIFSAVVALPPTLAAIHFGSPYFEVFVAVGCAVLIWEWGRLCGRKAASIEVTVAGLCLIGAVLTAGLGHFDLGFAALGAGAVLAGVAASLFGRAEASAGAPWLSAGVLYIGIPVLSLVWLRDAAGRDAVYWLFALVWATDTGAYAFGRMIGGPKLLPRVSPKKTWAGLIGGIICAGGVGAAFAFGIGQAAFWPLAVYSGFLAIVAQSGDLFESWVKRRFGVKDSGAIMPGHGGLLDRVDGLMAVAAVVALVSLINRDNGLVWF